MAQDRSTAQRSSWLAHLPPVLWDDGRGDGGSSLGEALRVFEKVFTGLPDDVATTRPPVTDGIAEAARQLDPWTARTSFLPWLASWVDLELPSLRGEQLWSERRRRAVIAGIAATYRRRGRPAGLADHVRLLAGGGDVDPRIAVDDGARVLAIVPGDDGPAAVTALLCQGPVVSLAGAAPKLVADGVIRPNCVALGADGALYLADADAVADPATDGLKLGSRIWRLNPDGRYRVTGGAGPTPVVTGLGSRRVRGLAVAPPRDGRPETLYLLDDQGRLSAVPTATPGATPTKLAELAVSGVNFLPAALAVDATGDLLVLVGRDEPGVPNPPQVVTVAAADGTVRPRRTLTEVTAPQSLLVEPDGSLLVGDGGPQTTDAPPDRPGNLVRVDRSGATWTETVLLPPDRARNPLVAPTGLVRAADGTLFVLDAGLRPLDPGSDPFLRAVADDPVVHRVALDAPDGPVVTPASERGRMVYPTGMVGRAGRLVVCDPGQPFWGSQPRRWTRLLPFWFEVVVHVAVSRLPDDDAARRQVLTRTVVDIQTVVERHKPAHTIWTTIN